jgi:hypothetical protein
MSDTHLLVLNDDSFPMGVVCLCDKNAHWMSIINRGYQCPLCKSRMKGERFARLTKKYIKESYNE